MGVANELADFERVEGDPGMVRQAAASLREAAGHLPVPSGAAGRLQDVAGGVSWTGDAHDAYRRTLSTLPMPDHLARAGDVMQQAADCLDWYAERLRQDQEAIDACRQRWLALGVPEGGEVPDELTEVVQQIDDEAAAIKQGHRGDVDHLAGVFESLTGQTSFAQPPPGIMDRAMGAVGTILEFNANFALGVAEGAWEMVKGLATLAFYLNPLVLPYTAHKVWENRDQIAAVARYAWENPGDFALALGRAVVDWETLTSNPARWLGKLVPDIILAVLTAGSSRVATTAARAAHGIDNVTTLARAAERTADATSGLSRTEQLLNRGRRFGARAPEGLGELSRGDTGGLTRVLYEFEQETTIGGVFNRPVPGLNTSASGMLRNTATLGWNGRLMTVDRWVNGMPEMSAGQRAAYVASHSATFAKNHQNRLAAVDEAFDNLVEDVDGRPPDRFNFNWTGDRFDVSTPWDR